MHVFSLTHTLSPRTCLITLQGTSLELDLLSPKFMPWHYFIQPDVSPPKMCPFAFPPMGSGNSFPTTYYTQGIHDTFKMFSLALFCSVQEWMSFIYSLDLFYFLCDLPTGRVVGTASWTVLFEEGAGGSQIKLGRCLHAHQKSVWNCISPLPFEGTDLKYIDFFLI